MEDKVVVNGINYIKEGVNIPEINEEEAPYKLGQNYHIRTVTMAYSGKLIWIGPHELVLSDCCWISDSGRFMDYLNDTSKALEVEPMRGNVIVGRGGLIDATEIESLPREQK